MAQIHEGMNKSTQQFTSYIHLIKIEYTHHTFRSPWGKDCRSESWCRYQSHCYRRWFWPDLGSPGHRRRYIYLKGVVWCISSMTLWFLKIIRNNVKYKLCSSKRHNIALYFIDSPMMRKHIWNSKIYRIECLECAILRLKKVMSLASPNRICLVSSLVIPYQFLEERRSYTRPDKVPMSSKAKRTQTAN